MDHVIDRENIKETKQAASGRMEFVDVAKGIAMICIVSIVQSGPPNGLEVHRRALRRCFWMLPAPLRNCQCRQKD